MVLDADYGGFTFVRTGDVLADGSYTLTLRSGASAFHAADGILLDGDGDGTGGDDYVASFDVTDADGPRVGIGDFARGPEQEAGVVATLGVPLTIRGAGDFTTASFEVHYDPAMLTVTGIEDPVGGTATVDLSVAGVASIGIVFDTPVSGDDLVIGRLLGTVPGTAPYGAKQLLDVRNVVVDGDATLAQDDDGIHVVAFMGDATGNAGYTSLDAQRVLRTVLRFDSGFGAYPLADPLIIGDVSGSGRLEAFDALLILREVLDFPIPEIPDLPANPPAVVRSGPDPLLTLGPDTVAYPGALVKVPVQIDTAAGLDAAQLRVKFDAQALRVVRVDRGTLTGDFEWFLQDDAPGELSLDMSRMHALSDGSGTLAQIVFEVLPEAPVGRYAIDMEWARLNEGGLTLNIDPVGGVDGTDTSIRVKVPRAPAPALPPVASATDAQPQAPLSALLVSAADVPAPALPAGTVPNIDLSVRTLPAAAERTAAPKPVDQPWLGKFVAGESSSAAATNPNAKLRIPVAPQASTSVTR